MATVSASDAKVDQPPANNNTGDDEEGADEEEGDEASPKESGEEASLPLAGATCQLYLRLAGLIDAQAEIAKAQTRIALLEKTTSQLNRDRARPQYAQKVPLTKQAADAQKVRRRLISALCVPSFITIGFISLLYSCKPPRLKLRASGR